jgi:hypothetical protein
MIPELAEPMVKLRPEQIPNIDDLVIEDAKAVDSIFTEKQMRLLTEPLYSSWPGPGQGRPFLALANVGLFYAVKKPPIVPDVMLSLDVGAKDPSKKENNSYFLWIMEKTPDVTLEIVSDRRGGEDTSKMRDYARIGIPFYAIFDPKKILSRKVLRAFELQGRNYRDIDPMWFPQVGLGLKLWQGKFEDWDEQWLRWRDKEGIVIPTGRERAENAEKLNRQLAAQLRMRNGKSPKKK